MKKRVVVLGGYGTFGGRISRALAADELIECVVAGRTRRRGERFARGVAAAFREADVDDPGSLQSVIDGAFAVVNACGPFHGDAYTVARQCIEAGVHYMDLAGARAWIDGITRLNDAARRNGVMVVSGAGSVPAVSSILVDAVAHDFASIEEIHTAISPGNRSPRGAATARAVLSNVGRPVRLMEKGRWRNAVGWGEPEVLEFALPVGRRRVYLCDAPDLDLFPTYYGARTVSFRAGLQLDLFNYGLALLGRMHRRGWIRDLPGHAGALIRVSKLFQGLGDGSGAIRVAVRGRKGPTEITRVIELVARDDNGPAISCSPSIALIRKWVREGVPATGAVPCVGLLKFDDIRAELKPYDVIVVFT